MIVQIVSHLGLAILSQNIFSEEQEGQRREVRGLATRGQKQKTRKVTGDSHSQIYEQLGKMILPQTK